MLQILQVLPLLYLLLKTISGDVGYSNQPHHPQEGQSPLSPAYWRNPNHSIKDQNHFQERLPDGGPTMFWPFTGAPPPGGPSPEIIKAVPPRRLGPQEPSSTWSPSPIPPAHPPVIPPTLSKSRYPVPPGQKVIDRSFPIQHPSQEHYWGQREIVGKDLPQPSPPVIANWAPVTIRVPPNEGQGTRQWRRKQKVQEPNVEEDGIPVPSYVRPGPPDRPRGGRRRRPRPLNLDHEHDSPRPRTLNPGLPPRRIHHGQPIDTQYYFGRSGGLYAPKFTKYVPITRFYHDSIPGTGEYNVEFETGNGIVQQESGYVKKIPVYNASTYRFETKTVNVKTGTVSWRSPEGIPFSMSYIADENGFRVSGDHLVGDTGVPKALLPGPGGGAGASYLHDRVPQSSYDYDPIIVPYGPF